MSNLPYPEYMRGLCNAPRDDSKCNQCGGIGLKPVVCCSGQECVCKGMPVDFVECDCGSELPTDEQIWTWVPRTDGGKCWNCQHTGPTTDLVPCEAANRNYPEPCDEHR